MNIFQHDEYELQCIQIQNSQKQSNLIVTKLKLFNLNYILDYKLVIEKILKLAIRQVIKIYVVYSAQNQNITFAYITQFEI